MVKIFKFIQLLLFVFNDPSRSDLTRVDPTRTGGPNRSVPTFVLSIYYIDTDEIPGFFQ